MKKRLQLSLLVVAAVVGQLTGLTSSQGKIIAPAQEFLGQYTYFRGWSTRRRLFVVKTSDDKMDRILKESLFRFRCQLALRSVNLILIGDTKATETVFYYSTESRRDFVTTKRLDSSLRRSLLIHLYNLHRDLGNFREWSLLIGYDGGRKRMYRKVDQVNFVALFDKIDSMPIRQREMAQQRQQQIDCAKR